MGLKFSYYNRNAKYQYKANMLLDLIPSLGQPCVNSYTTNRYLEKFRKHWIFYHDCYCDSYVYKKRGIAMEKKLEEIILKAYKEQIEKI